MVTYLWQQNAPDERNLSDIEHGLQFNTATKLCLWGWFLCPLYLMIDWLVEKTIFWISYTMGCIGQDTKIFAVWLFFILIFPLSRHCVPKMAREPWWGLRYQSVNFLCLLFLAFSCSSDGPDSGSGVPGAPLPSPSLISAPRGVKILLYFATELGSSWYPDARNGQESGRAPTQATGQLTEDWKL